MGILGLPFKETIKCDRLEVIPDQSFLLLHHIIFNNSLLHKGGGETKRTHRVLVSYVTSNLHFF